MQDKLIKYVYNGIREIHIDHTWLMEMGILSPHNDSVNEINENMIEEMPEEEKYSNADKVCRQERNNEHNANDFENIAIEFLNNLNYPGFPKHKLRLKKNIILM